VIVGAAQMQLLLKSCKGKNIAVAGNHTSMINQTHIVDSLLSHDIKVKKIFAPEHGFRGEAANGEHVKNGKDLKTGLPIISLYGEHKKPTKQDLNGIDLVVFDIQDVGVRFYTYLTTMHYIMEACAENHVALLVLDRPNPHISYIDGPILNPKEAQSMVGLHPIPLVHGMTLGELSMMIKGERWIHNSELLMLNIIPVKNYNRTSKYELPISPSPNLPTSESILLYPSLGLMEGTVLSMGRGTDSPFTIYGAPWFRNGDIQFSPKSIKGKAMHPPFEGKLCRGISLNEFAKTKFWNDPRLYLEWIINAYNESPDKDRFFNSFFIKLSGGQQLLKWIRQGKTVIEIRNLWKPEIEMFIQKRKPYLIYPDS
jgi:uncharacterized protein YbbC (DUF1343 family)